MRMLGDMLRERTKEALRGSPQKAKDLKEAWSKACLYRSNNGFTTYTENLGFPSPKDEVDLALAQELIEKESVRCDIKKAHSGWSLKIWWD